MEQNFAGGRNRPEGRNWTLKRDHRLAEKKKVVTKKKQVLGSQIKLAETRNIKEEKAQL